MTPLLHWLSITVQERKGRGGRKKRRKREMKQEKGNEIEGGYCFLCNFSLCKPRCGGEGRCDSSFVALPFWVF
jgi:hypothetical protein